jgi:hypothetical protein
MKTPEEKKQAQRLASKKYYDKKRDEIVEKLATSRKEKRESHVGSVYEGIVGNDYFGSKIMTMFDKTWHIKAKRHKRCKMTKGSDAHKASMQQVKDLVVKINENKDYTAKKIAECFKNGVTFTDEQHPFKVFFEKFYEECTKKRCNEEDEVRPAVGKFKK